MMIGTLVIGENVAHIGKAAFGFNTYKKAVVCTVQADVPPRSDVDMELPICTEIEIHRGSPYYDYFAKSTQEGHITLLCEDFETTRGEEYYDAQKKAFVTSVTDACTVCGYGETSEESFTHEKGVLKRDRSPKQTKGGTNGRQPQILLPKTERELF